MLTRPDQDHSWALELINYENYKKLEPKKTFITFHGKKIHVLTGADIRNPSEECLEIIFSYSFESVR